MARASLIFRYQWRAFWRRALRTGRVKFYLSVLALLGWITARALPETLSRAARELAAGQTTSMDMLLASLCLLWMLALGDDLNVSVTTHRLRRFPVHARTLLALELVSIFLSPIAWLATIVSLIGLSPLPSARHPLLGSLAVLLAIAIAIGLGMSVSELRHRWRGRRLVPLQAAGVVAALSAVIAAPLGVLPSRASLVGANPAAAVTAVAVARAAPAIAIPLATLLVTAVAVWSLLLWSLRRRLRAGPREQTAHRRASLARFPGRLGPLVQREHRSIWGVLDVWMAVVPASAAAALSISTPLPPVVRQAVFVVVCAANVNVTLNCLGLDRPAGLTRYLILPVRGSELFLAKNLAMMLVVGLQLALLLAVGAWQSGLPQLGADIVVAIVLVLAHLAWGNVVSVFEPRRTEPHRFSSGGEPVTTLASVAIGSAHGVAVILLLRADPGIAAPAIAAIVLLTAAAYYGSLVFAGRRFQRRIEIISRRLA